MFLLAYIKEEIYKGKDKTLRGLKFRRLVI